MGKKKKRGSDFEADTEAKNNEHQNEAEQLINGDSRSKKKKRDSHKGTSDASDIPTVTVAVPGSIIHNAQSLELATRLASQIARAATIFRVDEVVVFDGKNTSGDDSTVATPDASDDNETGAAFLIRILQYLETPQYLRKSLFPKHNSLKFVGMLPPLDAPHHLRKHEWGPYREGVTLQERAPNCAGTLVDVGLNKNVVINQVLEPGLRVTVAMGTNRYLDADILHQVVSSSKPREEVGTYWGYKVRYASNISSVFKECPFESGYDHLIGTSEHGLIVKSSELTIPPFSGCSWKDTLPFTSTGIPKCHFGDPCYGEATLPTCPTGSPGVFAEPCQTTCKCPPAVIIEGALHLLIAFGGLAGLEECVEEDHSLKGKNVREIFHSYLNTCPNQGSRTIRTEEAIFISLQYFQEPISRALQIHQNQG